jgi:hypothetical protein
LINQPAVLLIAASYCSVRTHYLHAIVVNSGLAQLVACTETSTPSLSFSLTTSVPLFPISPEAGTFFTIVYSTNAMASATRLTLSLEVLSAQSWTAASTSWVESLKVILMLVRCLIN